MVQVNIEAVQYTPDREPVLVQWRAVGSGPLARSQQYGTTQAALIARSTAPGYWGDDEVKQELVAYLAGVEIDAEVVSP